MLAPFRFPTYVTAKLSIIIYNVLTTFIHLINDLLYFFGLYTFFKSVIICVAFTSMSRVSVPDFVFLFY